MCVPYDAGVSDLGVVDPIRVPPQVRLGVDRLRALPVLAQVFIALAILDAIAHAIGVFEPSFSRDPVSVIWYAPLTAVILLPAVVVIRRPTAVTDTPWIVRGAVFVSVVALLAGPTTSFLRDLATFDATGAQVAISVIQSLVVALAYVVLARGLVALNPSEPKPIAAGLANLAAGGYMLAYLVGYVVTVITDLRVADAPDLALPVITATFGLIGQLGFAYLLRSVARGLDDPNRPERATRLGAAAAVLIAISTLLGAALGAMSLVSLSTPLAYPYELALALAFMSDIGTFLLVAAFALGLADPIRPLAKEWDAAAMAGSASTAG